MTRRFVLLLTMVVPLWAQSELLNARLSGTVFDAREAAVPGARVTLANLETAFKRESATGNDGQFIFTSLPPGRYQLKVEKDGFSTYVQPNVILTLGQSSTMNPRLEVGAMSQVIEVVAGSPLLSTGNVDIGSEINARHIVELPLNTRNVYGLVGLSSAVNNSQTVQGFT